MIYELAQPNVRAVIPRTVPSVIQHQRGGK